MLVRRRRRWGRKEHETAQIQPYPGWQDDALVFMQQQAQMFPQEITNGGFPGVELRIIITEPRFPNRFDDAAQSMTDYPVAEGCCADQAALGFEDIEVMVSAQAVGVVLQFILQAQQVPFQVKFKICHGGPVAFAAPGQSVSLIEVLEARNLCIEILKSLHFSKGVEIPRIYCLLAASPRDHKAG